jgi:hypothetical protein
MTREQRHALEMLAGAPRGITEAALATNGLAGDLLADLVRDRLVTVESEMMWGNGQPVETLRVRISDAGRRALRTLYVVPSVGQPFEAFENAQEKWPR